MNTLPDDLRIWLKDAQIVLDQLGRVPIWYRQALYGALGRPAPLIPEIDFEPPQSPRLPSLQRYQQERGGIPDFHRYIVPANERTPGHLRRMSLALRTVDYVLSRYDNPAAYRNDIKQYDMIQTIMTRVRRIYAGAEAKSQSIGGSYLVDAYTETDIIHWAAMRAASAAIYDADLRVYPLPPVRSDDDLYAFRHDTAGLVALVPTMTALAEEEAAAHVVTFWRWWLEQAIPAAWHDHPA